MDEKTTKTIRSFFHDHVDREPQSTHPYDVWIVFREHGEGQTDPTEYISPSINAPPWHNMGFWTDEEIEAIFDFPADENGCVAVQWQDETFILVPFDNAAETGVYLFTSPADYEYYSQWINSYHGNTSNEIWTNCFDHEAYQDRELEEEEEETEANNW